MVIARSSAPTSRRNPARPNRGPPRSRACASGTVTLELGLAGVPMVVAGLYACRPLLIEDQLERVG